MANNINLSGLTNATQINADDFLHISDGAQDLKFTAEQLTNYISNNLGVTILAEETTSNFYYKLTKNTNANDVHLEIDIFGQIANGATLYAIPNTYNVYPASDTKRYSRCSQTDGTNNYTGDCLLLINTNGEVILSALDHDLPMSECSFSVHWQLQDTSTTSLSDDE